jgi:hypothetical protein
VGHNPDLSWTLAGLCGDGLTMRKGTLARVVAESPFRDGGGMLRWLVPPDLLEPVG